MVNFVFYAVLFSGACPGKPLPFRIGDTWKFNLKILGVEVGISQMKIDKLITTNGIKLLKVDAFVRSNDFLERFYVLNDRLTAYINPRTLRAVLLKKWIKEGKYEDYLEVKFDYKKLEGFVKGKRKFARGQKFKLTPRARDFLSAILYYSVMDYREGEKYIFEYELAPKIKKTVFKGHWDDEWQEFKGKKYRKFVFEQVGELDAQFFFLVDPDDLNFKLPYAMYVPAYKVPIFGTITIDVYMVDFLRGKKNLNVRFVEPDCGKKETKQHR